MSSLEVGQTLRQARLLFARTFPGVAVFALAVSAVSMVRQYIVQQLLFGSLHGNSAAALGIFTSGWYWGSLLLTVLLASFSFAGGIGGMLRIAAGHQVSFGECVAIGFDKLGPVLLVSVLLWLGITFGTILLFVPGIILMTMWAVVLPVAIQEEVGVGEAFGRSRALTKGSRWKILAIVVMAGAVLGGLMLVTMRFAGISAANPAMPPVLMVPMVLVGTVTTLMIDALMTAIYVELREDRHAAAEFA